MILAADGSDMEVIHQDRLQLITEKRKWQTEIENKRRQLEDDRRTLQHLKSKALRERWLLDGTPTAGPEQDEVKKQLEEDEEKTRSLEETIGRLEQELVKMESGTGTQTISHIAVTAGSVEDVEVKGPSDLPLGGAMPPDEMVQAPAEIKIKRSPRVSRSIEATDELKRAMYSVEIKVERDKATGETRVLSTNTTLPVDLSHQGVKVYEDKQKVVHEMNGEDGVHLLSSSEVEELIHKADEASMMSPTVTTVTSLPTAEVQDEPLPDMPPQITGLETKACGEPSVAEASADNPVTMVFMGYQSVEDEDETKKVLGLQGTVKAELVLIDDANGIMDPPPPALATPRTSSASPTSTTPPERTASNGEMAGKAAGETVGETVGETTGETPVGGVVQVKKEKQPCKCCSIM
ncbi:paralemmin 1a isoform 1-T1 [Menidia menidia]